MYLLDGDDVRSDLVFLAHPRTASVAMRRTLRELGRLHQIKGHHGMDVNQIPSDALVFATVRNPWDLFVSWWFKRRGERSPFYDLPLEDFIPLLVENNGQFFKGGKLFYMAEHTNHILSYEHLQAHFDLMLVGVGYSPRDLVVANQSGNRPSRSYQEHYTFTARQWIAEKFAAEIEKYGYQF